MTTRCALLLPALLCGVLATGCALTSKATPLELRFFTPASVGREFRAGIGQSSSDLALRLGRIESGAHIEQRIAFRKSETELGYHQALRWTEPPVFYLRDQLATALFDERGVSRIVTGIGPTLDLELNEFEELLFGEHRVRVALRFVLRDDQRAILDQVVVVERALNPRAASTLEEGVAHAMAIALSEATSTVANRVVEKLEAEGSAVHIKCDR